MINSKICLQKEEGFDPNAASTEDSGVFGLETKEADAKIVYIPVPWELTASYGKGTAKGPEAIFKASKQIDLYHPELGRIYEAGFYMLPIETVMPAEAGIQNPSRHMLDASLRWHDKRSEINYLSEQVNLYVYEQSKRLLNNNQLVGVVGGDHSSPFGAIEAMAERESFGILHLDAHLDLRDAYEGYTWSHASIMRNVLERLPQVNQLVQVGIRDFCEEELEFAKSQGGRVIIWNDFELMQRRFANKAWTNTCQEIIQNLPQKVWVSFDIDALDPRFCPGTGTPVPGGLDFQEAYYLIREVQRSGRQIIGFDLCEVGSSEWDGNVGARMLYHLTGFMLESS